MAPSDGCDRAHQDIREKTLGIERDLESVQRLLEAITNILRDNLVTLSGHDKAAQDMRGFLVGIAKDLQERMIHLEGAMTGWADFQDGLESAFAKL